MNRTAKLDLGGTIRSRSASETLRVLRPLLPALGITRVARITGLDHIGVPTSVAVRPNAKHLATAQGKGINAELADVSAIMECIEGYHAENVEAPDEWVSYNDKSRKGETLDPRSLARGERWSAWHPDLPMRWVEGRDLKEDQPIFLPFIFVTMDSSASHPETAILDATTNGLASGNTVEEAACHALFEIVERECETRWERLPAKRKNATRLDLSTVDTPFLRDLIDRIEGGGLQLLVWDTSGPFDIPTFRCILADADVWRRLGRYHGSGAHFSKHVALARAITEAAQARLTWIHGTREDVYPSLYEDLDSIASVPVHLPKATRRWDASPQATGGESFEDDLEILTCKLRDNGYRKAILYRHTDARSPVHVVKVVVPGMQFSGNRI